MRCCALANVWRDSNRHERKKQEQREGEQAAGAAGSARSAERGAEAVRGVDEGEDPERREASVIIE